jgi:hypothetical protein
MTQKNRKKFSAGCSLLRAKGFFCSLYILYGDLGIGTVNIVFDPK